MSITKNVFTLKKAYELIVDGQWVQYDVSADPGELWVWGQNYGNFGDGTTISRSSPIQVPGINWSDVNLSTKTAYGIKSDGTLWSWGVNLGGALGLSNTINSFSPNQIPGTNWCAISPFDVGNVFGLKTDGTLWAWGDNDIFGSLGLDSTIARSSPTQIPGNNWSLAVGGFANVLATKTDGTLWVWGRNVYGALGLNDIISRSSPIQIPGTSWFEICAQNALSAALKTDGTLWVWGNNNTGQLGQNNIICRSSPIQIPGTSWNKINSASSGHNYKFFLATKNDSTLWAWGYNNVGRLGLGNTINRSSPTQIPGTNWKQASGAENGAYAVKKDGTLWAWGNNSSGEIGDNTTINRSSPTQIPGNTWVNVSGGDRAAMARKSV